MLFLLLSAGNMMVIILLVRLREVLSVIGVLLQMILGVILRIWGSIILREMKSLMNKIWVVVYIMIVGFGLAFAANNNKWPVNFFYVEGTEYISYQSWGTPLPSWFWIVRYGGVVLIGFCEGIGLVYLNRVVTEIRFPNLANSVKAIGGKLDDWFVGWGIKYSDTTSSPDTEPASTSPDDSDAAPWLT